MTEEDPVLSRAWVVQGQGFLKWYWEFTIYYHNGTQVSYVGMARTKWGATRQSKRIAYENGWE